MKRSFRQDSQGIHPSRDRRREQMDELPVNNINLKQKARGRRSATLTHGDHTEEELEFMKAMDRYKRENRRPFPLWSEVLDVIKKLGYRKAQ